MKSIHIKDEILALTGIRAFAAVWVVGYHTYLTLGLLFPAISRPLSVCFKLGYLGVDLFFLLSGFIIALNYCHKVYPFDFRAYRDFIWARLSRIYPVHLVTLLACLGLYLGARMVKAHLNYGTTIWGAKDFVANIFMVQSWTNHYHRSWNFPSWSISCEWLAYLLFPALAALFAPKWSRAFLWTIVGLLLGGQLCLHLVHWQGLGWYFSGIAFEFPVGICLFRLYEIRPASGKPFQFPVQPTLVFALAAMMVVCSILNVFEVSLIPFMALLLYSTAVTTDGFFSRILASRFACYWGRVSYSLYMTHAVTSMVMIRILPLQTYAGRSLTTRLAASGLYYVALAAVAMLVYHLVEEPSRWRMRKMFQPTK